MSNPPADRALALAQTFAVRAAVVAGLLTLAGCPAPTAAGHPRTGGVDSDDPVDPSAACPPGTEREGGPYDGCPAVDGGSGSSPRSDSEAKRRRPSASP
jgi:hypothetical protein